MEVAVSSYSFKYDIARQEPHLSHNSYVILTIRKEEGICLD